MTEIFAIFLLLMLSFFQFVILLPPQSIYIYIYIYRERERERERERVRERGREREREEGRERERERGGREREEREREGEREGERERRERERREREREGERERVEREACLHTVVRGERGGGERLACTLWSDDVALLHLGYVWLSFAASTPQAYSLKASIFHQPMLPCHHDQDTN